MKRITFLFPIMILTTLFAFQSCKKAKMEKWGDWVAMDHGGKKRHFILHLPMNYDENIAYPVVLAYHGGTRNPDDIAKYSNFNDLADREGFIVIYPEGFRNSWADARGTTKASEAGIDDVDFTSSIIDWLEANYSIDANRVYATGPSNGGFMSWTLTCQLSNRIAASAPVIAGIPDNLISECQGIQRPVSFLMIPGTEDNLVPYEGGEVNSKAGGTFISMDSTLRLMAGIYNCPLPADTAYLPDNEADGTTVDIITYFNCQDSSIACMYKVVGGGHTWPGVDTKVEWIIGTTSQEFDATEAIWQFFKDKRLN